jgi:hypothetical protein
MIKCEAKYLLGNIVESVMKYILHNAVLDYAACRKADLIYCNIEMTREGLHRKRST